jgi:hypothetical protein
MIDCEAQDNHGGALLQIAGLIDLCRAKTRTLALSWRFRCS